MSIILKSSIPKFSFALGKNPLTSPVTAIRSSNGTFIGFFSDDQTYVAFYLDDSGKESYREITFAEHVNQNESASSFVYSNFTQHNSPDMLLDVIETFFKTARTKPQLDVEQSLTHSLTATTLHISKQRIEMIIQSFRHPWLVANVSIDCKQVFHHLYQITLASSTLSLDVFLEYCFLFFFLTGEQRTISNTDVWNKCIRSMDRLPLVPYILRYRLSNKIPKQVFPQFKERLERVNEMERKVLGYEKINLQPGNSQDHRQQHIWSALEFKKDHPIQLIDVGCGGGELVLKVAKRLNQLAKPVDLMDSKGQSRRAECQSYDLRRIDNMMRDGVQFISGTICPAAADAESLESIREALRYFQSNGVPKVIIEIKHMGSRGNFYFYPHNVDKSFMVTRNGFRKHDMDRKVIRQIHQEMCERLELSEILPITEMMIIDMEILPWSYFGDGLIRDQYEMLYHTQFKFLHSLFSLGFEDALERLEHQTKEQSQTLSKSHKDTLLALTRIRQESDFFEGVETHLTALEKYWQQVQVFGKRDGPVEIRPFSILKRVSTNDDAWVWDNFKTRESNLFYTLNPFKFREQDGHLTMLHLDLSAENAAQSLETSTKQVEAFYKAFVEPKLLEGIVIKADQHKPSVAPFLKWRNPEYLRLIYGYDYLFPKKYQRLKARKSVKSKLKASIREYEIGLKMLEHEGKNVEDFKEFLQIEDTLTKTEDPAL